MVVMNGIFCEQIEYEVQEAEKANMIESKSRWFLTIGLPRVVEFGSRSEKDANVNLVVQMKVRVEAP